MALTKEERHALLIMGIASFLGVLFIAHMLTT
jgi:hypothetical protein